MRIRQEAFDDMKQSDRIEYLLRRQQIEERYSGSPIYGLIANLNQFVYLLGFIVIFFLLCRLNFGSAFLLRIFYPTLILLRLFCVFLIFYGIYALIKVFIDIMNKRNAEKELLSFFKVKIEDTC